MRIARFWAKAEVTVGTDERGMPWVETCWRGSASSLAEAKRLAAEAAERMRRRIERREPFPQGYGYGEGFRREELLEEFTSRAGEIEAAITRNGYGAEILNTARVCFIDVDLPPPSLAAWLSRLFGSLRGRRPSKPNDDPAIEKPLDRLDRWLAMHPDWGVRVYRTHSGLRYLVTHALLDPGGREIEAAMNYLGADVHYVKLCRAQQSFRARLTPKPWRCDVPIPPVRFPYDDPQAERDMYDWVRQYGEAASRYAVCRLLGERGSDRVVPAAKRVIEVHDKRVRAEEPLPLA